MSRFPSLLSSLLLSSQVRGTAPRSQPTESSRVDYRLGNPGRPPKYATLLAIVVDDSGSLYGPAGNDPVSNRYREAERAIAAIAKRGSGHELAAVVHFDTPSSGEVGPVPLTKRGLAMLQPGLQAPYDGAGTSNLAPSLRRATEIAKAHPDHQATLVVLSDLLLTDSEPGEVLSDLAAFPGTVHAVVLGTRLPDGLLDDSLTVTHVGRQDPPGAVARALFRSLTTHRPGSRPA